MVNAARPSVRQSTTAVLAADAGGPEREDSRNAWRERFAERHHHAQRRTVQVTYNGHPLYYFVNDKKPGEINCQAVVNFGAAWYVRDPSGNAITKS